MRVLDLFSGIGGFSLGLEWAGGFETVAFVERDKFCKKILTKHWPNVPVFDDIKTFHWFVDENDVKSYNEECEMKSKGLQTSEILNLLKRQKPKEESPNHAKIAERKNLYPKALQLEIGDFVAGNAGQKLCEETRDQTQAAENGCRRKETLKLKSHSGEEGYLQEINTHAKNAELSQNKAITLERIISRDGATIQQADSILKTGEQYAKNATTKRTIQREKIDLLTAGVPCQPASCAGKRRGAADDRWLWGETFRIIREAKPTWIILENVYGLLTLEQGLVFEDLLIELEAEGYEVQPIIIPACAVNAPHRRDRVWIIARRHSYRGSPPKSFGGEFGKEGNSKRKNLYYRARGSDSLYVPASHSEEPGLERGNSTRPIRAGGRVAEHAFGDERNHKTESWDEPWPQVASRLCRVDARVPDRVDRLKSLGNSVVPQIVYEIGKAIFSLSHDEWLPPSMPP